MKFSRILLTVLLVIAGLLGPVPTTVINAQNAQQQTKEVTVYVTDTGKRYHRASCRYLRYSRRAMLLSDAVKDGYTPCHVCKPPVLRE